MEPLSALSVAAAVVQFIDFSGNIVKSTCAIYKSAKRGDDTNDIATITESLRSLSAGLEQSTTFSPASKLDTDIVKLCQECRITAQGLLDALQALNGASNATVWNSFKIALKTVWNQGQIDAFQSRLESFRSQITMHILVALRDKMQSLQQSNERQDAAMKISLDTTQALARQVLVEVDKQSSFHSDIIKAIERTNSWAGSPQPKSLAPRQLNLRDLEHFNSGLLRILKFDELGLRQKNIANPHASTLGWVFKPSTSPSGSTFAGWLSEDKPFYWIAGKAGSGKSTLMKYLNESPQLLERLQKWANGDELRILCFFFWNAATNIQMSLEGLIRTLLYQAMEQDRQYLSTCFACRFEVQLMFPGNTAFEAPLTWDELLTAFKAYLQEASQQRKLFLLIDGLDEFGGQPIEIVNFVSKLPGDRVKVCVSSRPWVTFEDAFGSKPSLRLDNHTDYDIKSFIEESFHANPGFVARETLDPDYAAQLIHNVTTKASGVFLWVALVVRSLMDGFSGGERLSDLQARLDELPSDLEQLFLQILSKLRPQHLQRSAQFFQMLRLARRQVSSLEFSFADEDDPEVVYNMPVAPLSVDVVHARLEILRRRLNECCKGLIEISTHGGRVDPRGTVSYLHRSVSDFWSKPENKRKLVDLQGEGFNPYKQLSLACIAVLKIAQTPQKHFFWDTISRGIGYAMAAEVRSNTRLPELFIAVGRAADEVDKKHDTDGQELFGKWMMSPMVNAMGHQTWTWNFRYEDSVKPTFFAFATVLRLRSYLDATISSLDKSRRRQFCSIALHVALIPDMVVARSAYSNALPAVRDKTTYDRTELIEMLVRNGADTNYINTSTTQTAWQTLWDGSSDPSLDTIKCFIAAGADREVVLYSSRVRQLRYSHPQGQELYEYLKKLKKQERGSVRATLSNMLAIKRKG